MNEFQIINKYFSSLSIRNKGSYNLKNDIFFDFKKKIAVSIDTYVEKKHFLNFKNPDLVIKKIFRAALSDLICKGVEPKYYFISGSGDKKNFNKKKLKLMHNALKREQKKFNIVLVGGDTTKSKVLSFTFVMVGYSKKPPVTRSGAKEGDDIYVTGNLGDAFIGLNILKKKVKHNKNEQKYFVNSYYHPRLQTLFSKKISYFASSSIDVSDGLFQDLNHLLCTNRLDYYIDVSKIPISKKLKIFLNKRKISKIKAVSNGDDYQILFTSNKKNRKQILRFSKKNSTKITRIGIVKSVNGKRFSNSIKNIGYIHNF